MLFCRGALFICAARPRSDRVWRRGAEEVAEQYVDGAAKTNESRLMEGLNRYGTSITLASATDAAVASTMPTRPPEAASTTATIKIDQLPRPGMSG